MDLGCGFRIEIRVKLGVRVKAFLSYMYPIRVDIPIAIF